MVLNALAAESSIIAKAIESMSDEEKEKYNTNRTAKEWFTRRGKNQRMKNRKVGFISDVLFLVST